jgi:hypothetical protein
VVKAAGYAATEVERELRYLRAPEQDGRCEGDIRQAGVTVTLPALPAFTRTPDYATGFDAATGLADFEALAVTSPTEGGGSRVVKFFIADLHHNPAVYFQNTRAHPLHYGFYRTVLRGALSLAQYEATTYFGAERDNLAGSIILYPDRRVPSAAWQLELTSPFTIEFFPSDNLSPEQALLAHRLLEERMLFAPLAGAEHRVAYLPASAAREAELVERERDFAAHTALWLTRAELYGNVRVQYLNAGEACGTLRRLSPEELASTPLSYRDIVVLTRLPNDLPLVGGTITEELQTPLAHVNVAARARGTPNMALLEASVDPRVAPFFGQLVRLQVVPGGFSLGALALSEAEAFWATLIPPEPFVPPADLATQGLLPFSTIGFADATRVGVKAANLAELSRLLSGTAPDGFAVPFFYFHQHMTGQQVVSARCASAQTACVAEGRSAVVCQTVADGCGQAAVDGLSLDAYLDRLLGDAGFTSDTVLREASLATLRHLVATTPVEPGFGAALDAAVAALVGTAKARLRSSTNAEDLEQFNGAGLYESYSSRVGTAEAPSLRIGLVWASVFTWPAFEERSFWNIDHHATKMGVAVHRSYPDEDCNGVLVTQSIANPAVSGFYVNLQVGELSVTNPEGGILPEILTLLPAGNGVTVLRDRFSTLSPTEPIMTDAELAGLYDAAAAAQRHFAVLYGADLQTFALEMELKVIPPFRKLVLKQARPFYQP